jgi:hypothetical protein
MEGELMRYNPWWIVGWIVVAILVAWFLFDVLPDLVAVEGGEED